MANKRDDLKVSVAQAYEVVNLRVGQGPHCLWVMLWGLCPVWQPSFGDRKVFPRRRVEPLVKALAVRLYHQGLSLRRVCEVLGELGDGWRFSYEALRRWYLKAGMLLPRGRRRRRAIALDETVVKVVGAKNWLWSAVDTYSEEPLASYLSPQRSFVHTTLFLDRVLERCENKPLVYTDNGPWYPWALELYGLRHRREASGRRNTVERWFNAVKARTKRFNNNFPFHSTLESAAR